MATRHMVHDQSGVRQMQRLCQRNWPEMPTWHIGDMAWGRYQHVGREAEWRTAYWTGGDAPDGEDVLAWAWARLPNHLDLEVDPACGSLMPEILDWFASVATEPNLEVGVLNYEQHVIAGLEAAGYAPTETTAHSKAGEPSTLHFHRRDQLDDLPTPVVPDGFTLRHVRIDDPEDLRRRVAVHRNAFNPSRVTEESYANVAAAWPYTQDLDWVVEAPDGRFAASCLIWIDEVNKVGELEPVGANSDFRRMGLARAACLGALHALRDAGATSAVVASHETPTNNASTSLYRGLGFVDLGYTVTYGKSA